MRYRLDNLSASDLIAGLQSHQWTSVELTQFFLNRILEFNQTVRAIPFVFKESALAQAWQSDIRRKAGTLLSPIDGLPMTIKDAIRIQDMKSTYGMRFFRKYRPKTDSQLIKILRDSGIVFLGRSAVPTAAFDWNCRNGIYPECVNPFDSHRTPGGSSGGAAAALAMNMTPLEFGSDLGGSIRYPAHCCGIFGLRTTDGWLPITDVGPERVPIGFRQLVTFGPMARNLEDLDLLLERFAEKFPTKSISPPIATLPLKIAYSNSLLGLVANTCTEHLFKELLMRLRLQGHILVETEPYPDADELFRIWGTISGHEYAACIPAILRNHLVQRFFAWWILDRRLGAGAFTNYFKKGLLCAAEEYDSACRRRKQVFDAVDSFFHQHHLWILPVAASSAIPLSLSGRKIPTATGLIEYSRYIGSYLVPTTTLGTPVLTCPIGRDKLGLPVGIQIHGPRFSDRWLIKVASRLNTLKIGGE